MRILLVCAALAAITLPVSAQGNSHTVTIKVPEVKAVSFGAGGAGLQALDITLETPVAGNALAAKTSAAIPFALTSIVSGSGTNKLVATLSSASYNTNDLTLSIAAALTMAGGSSTSGSGTLTTGTGVSLLTGIGNARGTGTLTYTATPGATTSADTTGKTGTVTYTFVAV